MEKNNNNNQRIDARMRPVYSGAEYISLMGRLAPVF